MTNDKLQMTNKIEQFIKSARETKLFKEEKTTIRQSILNFMNSNPIPTPERGLFGLRTRSTYPRLVWGNYASITALFLMFAIIASGGMAVGAEKALPGGFLYPVKVGINEEVRGWLSISEESKTKWEIKKAERRLEEAEKLADVGALDAEKAVEIEANFEAHAERVRERVDRFNDKEDFNAAASVSLNFEKALIAHERILSKLAERKGEFEIQVRPIRAKINAEVTKTSKNRQEINIKIKERENSIRR